MVIPIPVVTQNSLPRSYSSMWTVLRTAGQHGLDEGGQAVDTRRRPNYAEAVTPPATTRDLEQPIHVLPSLQTI